MGILKFDLTNIPYRKKLIIGNILSVIIILAGIFSLVLSIIMKNNNLNNISDFQNGFYCGTGGGLIGAGIVTIIRNTILLRNKEKFRKAEIKEKDERNRFIIQKAWSISGIIGMFLLYISVVIAGAYNSIVFITLLSTLCLYFLILIITMLVLQKIV